MHGSSGVVRVREWKVPTRRQMALAHSGMSYRRYRCTGNHCECEVIAMDRVHITCNTRGCRGTMAPRRRVPLAKVIDFEIARLRRRMGDTKSPVEGPSSDVFHAESRQFGLADQDHHAPDSLVSGDENGLDASGRRDCPGDNRGNQS